MDVREFLVVVVWLVLAAGRATGHQVLVVSGARRVFPTLLAVVVFHGDGT